MIDRTRDGDNPGRLPQVRDSGSGRVYRGVNFSRWRGILWLLQLFTMFVLGSLSVLVALSSCVYGSPTFGSSGHETKIVEKLASAPAGWTKDESIQLDKDSLMMKLRIHLVPQDMNKFHDLAMNVRTPRGEIYVI
jgi:hypothetical protein